MTGDVVPAEAALCRIFAEVLGLGAVRPDDAFFEVGGDSVLAIQVVARTREAGHALSVRDLFDHQTPGALAAVLLAEPRGAAPAGLPLPAPAGRELADFGDLEDEETGPRISAADAGWETVT